ncbi:Fumarylacetoacetate (FAA) hydrolase family protein [compost metagenome]|uniref:fumarylacetoacetate hydrolase family protein n=1 Tax=Cupriavidus necator TaxID=106590 RepID=UPI0028B43B27
MKQIDRLAAFAQDGLERAAAVDEEGRLLPLPLQFGDVLNIVQGGEARWRPPPKPCAPILPRRWKRGTTPYNRQSGASAATSCARVGTTGTISRKGWASARAQEVDRPSAPTFFTKGPDTVIGPDAPIAWDPRVSGKWDYEAEIVAVIGKDGRSIPAARAMENTYGATALPTTSRSATCSVATAVSGSRAKASTRPCRWALG